MQWKQLSHRNTAEAPATTAMRNSTITRKETLKESEFVRGGFDRQSSSGLHLDRPPHSNELPLTGLVRLDTVIGNKSKNIKGLIDIGRSTWLEGVRQKRFPPAYKIGRCTFWDVAELQVLMDRIKRGEVI